MTYTRARNTDPISSHEAGIYSFKWACNHHKIIMQAMYDDPRKEFTYMDIAEITELDPNQVARRMIEIEDFKCATRRGFMVRSYNGKRNSRYTAWALTDKAIERLTNET